MEITFIKHEGTTMIGRASLAHDKKSDTYYVDSFNPISDKGLICFLPNIISSLPSGKYTLMGEFQLREKCVIFKPYNIGLIFKLLK